MSFVSGEVQTSTYPGRVIVTEPKGNAQPRISVDKYNARRIVLGEDVTLPCVAQGYPVPGYYWKRELQGQSVPVALGERLTILSAGLLRISKVSENLLYEIVSTYWSFCNTCEMKRCVEESR